MSLVAFVLRLCVLAVMVLLPLSFVTDIADAHAGHEAVASAGVEAAESCSVTGEHCGAVAYAAASRADAQASECIDACCSMQVHCCPVLSGVEPSFANVSRRHVVPIIRAERADGIAPEEPPEPPNAVQN
jgi:hypothetical protein